MVTCLIEYSAGDRAVLLCIKWIVGPSLLRGMLGQEVQCILYLNGVWSNPGE